jgi:hypothetical protein
MDIVGKFFSRLIRRAFFSIIRKIFLLILIVILIAGAYIYFNPPEKIILFGEEFCLRDCKVADTYCSQVVKGEKEVGISPGISMEKFRITLEKSPKRARIDFNVTDDSKIPYDLSTKFVYHGINFKKWAVNHDYTTYYFAKTWPILPGIWEGHANLKWIEGKDTYTQECVGYILS